MTPLEALDRLVMRAELSGATKHIPVGGLVSRASPEIREALTRLTSGDTSSIRYDVVMYSEPKRKAWEAWPL